LKRTKALVIALLLVALSFSFGSGCLSLNISPTPDRSSDDLGLVQEAWDVIFDDYVERGDLDAAALREGAIRGMLEALDDPYSAYLDPETYQLSLSDLSGKFEGIGAHVAVQEDRIVIVAPILGSPAAEAGIQAGDQILAVDGEDIAGLSLTEVVLLVRGPRDTTVRLLVLHEGETEPVEIEIVRAEIELVSVNFEMRGDVAYINITHFSQLTDGELGPVIGGLADHGATGIVLDLRSNPGGLLPAVVDATSYFLTEGTVVDVVDNQGTHTPLPVERKSVTTDLPMVVLVDAFSASGSEVMAGALQDYDRAIVAGTQTFGKGSVNILRELSDGSGIYITTARWLTPQGRLIEGEGITPNIELELEGEAAIEWAIGHLQS
jgi:carboxyl-terminal processing protease